MSIFGNRDRRGIRFPLIDARVIPSLLCAAMFLFGSSVVFAQQVNSNAGATSIRNWVQNARDDASNYTIDFAFDNLDTLKLDPSEYSFAPRVNFGIDVAQGFYGWSGLAQEGIQLTYPMQPADHDYEGKKFAFDASASVTSLLVPSSAEILGGLLR